jgi:hypothetical protein
MKTYGRKAFGHQRPMTTLQKAANVAASILAHRLDTRDPQTWERYGLQDNPCQQALVCTVLQAEQADPEAVSDTEAEVITTTLAVRYCQTA